MVKENLECVYCEKEFEEGVIVVGKLWVGLCMDCFLQYLSDPISWALKELTKEEEE